MSAATAAMGRRLTEPFAAGADTLELALAQGADAGTAAVAPYGFAEHQARFERVPDPRYVLTCRRDAPPGTTLAFGWSAGGSSALALPDGLLAGATVAIPPPELPGPPPAPPGPRLVEVRMAPAPPDGRTDRAWGATALLGTTAKVLWVLGAERDRARAELGRVVAQRRRESAVGRALELLGHDLGVPRFVPRAHVHDDGTLALLHLDDPPRPAAGQPDAEDRAARHRPVSHHGRNAGGLAVPGVPGRFGTAFAFRAPDARIEIADHPELALPVARSFTVECFVRPDAGASGQLVSKQASPGTPRSPGWSLSLGDFGRGVPGSVRWLVTNGSAAVAVFSDAELTSDRFHHVAGVLDRARGAAVLHVDGREVAWAPLGPLGDASSAAPVRIGGGGGAAAAPATVDELRLSGVARTTFSPALGESDASYRRRLGVFERWTLPTPANVQAALNAAVGPIAGDPEPLVVDDAPATLADGAAPVRLEPAAVPAGGRIDALGRRRTRAAEMLGPPSEEELRLGSTWLVEAGDARAVHDAAPARDLAAGEEPPDPRRMHVAARDALVALLDRLDDEGVAGPLAVRAAFDPRGVDLQPVGRTLLLDHSGVARGRLAALAHAAGFDMVRHRSELRAVAASVAAAERLTVVPAAAAPPGPGTDVAAGGAMTLSVLPPLPSDARVAWVAIPCGAGRAHVEAGAAAPVATLRATAPGAVSVRVEASWRGRRASATRTLRIGPGDLPDGGSIAADGTVGAPPDVVERPGPAPFFHPVHLVHLSDPRARYEPGTGPRRAQRGTAERLVALLDLLGSGGPAGSVRVLEGWDPAAADLRARGRRLLLGHTALGAGALAAAAHAAGFGWVRRSGATVEVRHPEEALLALEAPARLTEGDAADVRIVQRARPQALAAAGDALYAASAGTDAVSELDSRTGAVRRAFKVGFRPIAVAVAASGKLLFTADEAGDTVSVVDLTTGRGLAPLAVGPKPRALVHHPRLARLYVACAGDATVRAFDTARLAPAGQVVVGPGSPALAVARDGRALWVACDGERQLRVLAADPLAPLGTVALPGAPGALALSTSSDRGWVALPDRRSVARVNVARPALEAEAALEERVAALALADGDAALYALADAGADAAGGLVLDAASGRELARFPLPRRAVALAAAGPRLYAAVWDVGVAAFERGAGGALARVGTWRLGTGLGEDLSWIARPAGEARARFRTTSRPETTLTAERAGPLLVRAVASLGEHGPPYTFEVRLKAALDRPQTLIGKEQYDLLMNVLNLLHPIGVEVRTQRVRERVLEVREGLLEAFPEYTYPNFRVPGPPPAAPREEE